MTIRDLKDNNLILFEVIAGSRAFGLDVPASDTDIKGVFYLPKERFYGLDYIPQISNETNDIVYYEIGRFIELLTKNNPNILEILATPQDCILYRHPLMESFKIDDFLSKLCKDTFGGYAASQIKKAQGLKKKIVNPVEKDRKSLLDFCYILSGHQTIPVKTWLEQNGLLQQHCGLIALPHSPGMYALFYDAQKTLGYKGIIQKENSNEVVLSSIKKGENVVAYLHCNLNAYSAYCKEYNEYWEWIKKRNEERYNTNREHGKNYDSKNMMHTIRLLESALRILTTGKLVIKVTNRDELLNIKAGINEYDDLLFKTEQLITAIAQAHSTSTLPEFPDAARAEQLLVNIRTVLYK